MSLQTGSLSAIQTIRLWKIKNKSLFEIDKPKLDLEKRLEDWIASDISIISPNLLVIGRQVETSYGGYIDLLCMDENGDLVIVELKRDKSPREITAQVLDYASWVTSLTVDQVQKIANKYDLSLDEVYEAKFNQELPETINQEHRMLIVGSEIDSSSQRIINYLSETYGVAINAITFNYFKYVDCEYLARTFLIEPSRAEMAQISRSGKRRRNLTEEQLQKIADEKEVGELYRYLVEKLSPFFNYRRTTLTTIGFKGILQRKRIMIFSLVPGESSVENGLKFRVYSKRFAEHFKISEERVKLILPKDKRAWKYYESAPPEYSGYEGFFKDIDIAKSFLERLRVN